MVLGNKKTVIGKYQTPEGRKSATHVTSGRSRLPLRPTHGLSAASRSDQGIALDPNSASYGIAVDARTRGATSVLALEAILAQEQEMEDSVGDS